MMYSKSRNFICFPRIKTKVWFITGASNGFGLILTKKLLARGDKVAATSRSLEKLIKAAGEKSDSFLPLQVDISSDESIKNAIDEIILHFGRLDSVVNNAGYGAYGIFEEVSEEELRNNFEVNFFSTCKVCRIVAPLLRSQRYGQIFNFSSLAGFRGGVAKAVYVSSKFAVVGFTECLKHELKPFGVEVSCVNPGPFRTNFVSAISMPENQIPEYADATKKAVEAMQSAQPGFDDAEKGIDALIKVSDQSTLPTNIFLGSTCYREVRAKLASILQEMDQYSEICEHCE